MIQILWITSEGYTKVVRQQRLAKTNNCTSETRIHQQTTKHRTSKTNQFNRNKNRTSKIPTQPVHKRQSNRRKHHHHPPFLINTVERNNATRASSGPHTHTHTHTHVTLHSNRPKIASACLPSGEICTRAAPTEERRSSSWANTKPDIRRRSTRRGFPAGQSGSFTCRRTLFLGFLPHSPNTGCATRPIYNREKSVPA